MRGRAVRAGPTTCGRGRSPAVATARPPFRFVISRRTGGRLTNMRGGRHWPFFLKMRVALDEGGSERMTCGYAIAATAGAGHDHVSAKSRRGPSGNPACAEPGVRRADTRSTDAVGMPP